jgi:RimJ/RimL family protein N-acetyltransferase
VSIYRVPESPGRGLGGSLLLAAEAWLRQRRPDVGAITAEVLADNERSHQLFRAAGYQLRSMTYVKQVQPS